jgi:hypothetical protein
VTLQIWKISKAAATERDSNLMISEQLPLPGADGLLNRLRSLCLPWRAMTIGVDGRNGAGKSSLARYISWQLGMPVLETDLWLMRKHPRALSR